MLDLTVSSDYREIIRSTFKSLGLSSKSVAMAAVIHPAFFSRVMMGKASFSPSQMFLIGKALQLDGWRLEYFLLLGDLEFAANAKHKIYLKQKIEKIRQEQQALGSKLHIARAENLEESLRLAKYYSETITARIHMYLTIPRYRQNPDLICRSAGISKSKFHQEIAKLESLGIITTGNGNIDMNQDTLHLEMEHVLAPQNNINWRLDAIKAINERNPKSTGYHMSAAFTADAATMTKVRNRFKAFVVEVKDLVSGSSNPDEEEVWSMGFDLY